MQIPFSQTIEGGGAWTPLYASPEQIRRELVGPESDVFSLGVILHELLTIEGPYRYEIREDRGDLSQAVLWEAAPLPSKTAPSFIRETKGINWDALDAIVSTALRKVPQRRYSNAGELADDLDRLLNNEPVKARPDNVWRRIRLVALRRKRRLGVACLILAIITLGIFTTNYEMNKRKHHELYASLLSNFVEAEINRSDVFDENSREKWIHTLRTTADAIDDSKGYPSRQSLMLHEQLSSSFNEVGLVEESFKQMHKAWEDSIELYGRWHVETQDLHLHYAVDLHCHHHATEAIEVFIPLLAWQEANSELNDPLFLTTRFEYAYALSVAGYVQEAARQMSEVLKDAEEQLGEEHDITQEIYWHAVDCYASAGQFADAHALIDKVIGVDETIDMTRSFQELSYNFKRALLYVEIGRADLAVDDLRLLYREILKRHGIKNGDTLWALNGFVSALIEIGEIAKATGLVNMLVTEAVSLYGPDHMQSLIARHLQAKCMVYEGRADVGIGIIDEVIQKRSKLYEPHHRLLINSRVVRIVALHALGRHQDAIAESEIAMELALEQLPDTHPVIMQIIDARMNRLPAWFGSM